MRALRMRARIKELPFDFFFGSLHRAHQLIVRSLRMIMGHFVRDPPNGRFSLVGARQMCVRSGVRDSRLLCYV